MTTPTRRGFVTADGTNTGAFGPPEWGLLGVTALIWGSSFLWIKICLEVLHPGALAFLRVALGALAISLIPAGRGNTSANLQPIDKSAYPVIAVLGLAGTIGPALLFAFAEQRIESSVAGMINSVGPLITLALSIVLLRKAPAAIQMLGLGIGFVGAVLLGIPNVTGDDAEPVGVLMVIAAICCYSISSNLLPPLVQKYGSAPVMFKAISVSAVLMLPYGVYGLMNSSFSWKAASAMFVLGIFGTGIARVMFAELIGRTGAPRASLVGYLVPVVAVVLGVAVRNESVSNLELVGLGLILLAAYFVSRAKSAD